MKFMKSTIKKSMSWPRPALTREIADMNKGISGSEKDNAD